MRNVKHDSVNEIRQWPIEDVQENDPQPWTAEQVRVWRSKNPNKSPWRIVWVQIVVAIVLTGFVLIVSSQKNLAMSVAYGGFCAFLPMAMFMHGVRMGNNKVAKGRGLVGFAVWELAKVVLTIVLLLLAPKLVIGLNWLALLAGFVVTIKAYWIALWMLSVRDKSVLVH